MDSYDIARLAGVSRKTVQRVLNNPSSVKPETREKILRVMEEHHYEPNSAARKLSSRKSHTVGLFIVQDAAKYTLHTDDLFFGAVIGAIISRCAALGYNTLVSMADVSDPAPLFSMFRQKSIDGGILVSWSDLRGIVEEMRKARYAVGLFDEGYFGEAPQGLPIPHLDNRGGAREAVRYLIGLGHRRIGIVTGDMANNTARERLLGFRDALGEAGLPLAEEHIHYGRFTEDDGVAAAERWLKEGALPEAVFCSNDLMAYGVLKTLAKAGVSVPGAVSVIGFDDLLISQYTNPPLTTMRVPRVEMAVQVADRLIAGLESGDAETDAETFTARLVVRQSCAPRERIPTDFGKRID